MSRLAALLAVLLLATTPATAGDAPSTRPSEPPPLYSNYPELLPSLGERRPVRAAVWSPHLVASGHTTLAADAELLVLDHEEFEPHEAADYAKIIHSVRQTSPVPVGIYGYGSRLYRLHANRALEVRLGKGPQSLDAKLAADLPRLEAQRPATAAAEVLCPTLYVWYDRPPEDVYAAARGQIADALAEARSAEAWAIANIRYYRQAPRGPRRVVAFVSPAFRGDPAGEHGLLSDEQIDAVLRACLDEGGGGVSPLVWFGPPKTEGHRRVLAAARRMTLRWYELCEEREREAAE